MDVASDILEAIRAHGVVSGSFRDAVHEAAHALDFGITRPWTRARVADGAPSSVADKFGAECIARAVEWTMCDQYGVAYDVVEWSCIAAMESIKNDGYSATLEQWRQVIEHQMGSRKVQELCRQIEALVVHEGRSAWHQ